MTNPEPDEELNEEDFQRLADLLLSTVEAMSVTEPLEGEVLSHYEDVVRMTDRFAARYFSEEDAEQMRSLAEVVASRHPDRFLGKEANVWAGVFKSMITMTNLQDLGPPDRVVRIMRAARMGDGDVQEVLDELHTYLPVPQQPPDARMAGLMGNLMGIDQEARSDVVRALEDQAANERVSDTLFEFDLKAVPAWIPEDKKKLYAEVVMLLDSSMGNELAEGADEILHFFAGGFIKYGSKSALANSATDIATGITIFFGGVMTGNQAEHEERMIELGYDNLLEIVRSTGRAVRYAAAHETLPDVLLRHMGR